MLYYIHGYLSSPQSTKGQILKKRINAKSIKYRDCNPEDLVISDCIKQIENIIKDDDEVTLIGSSLGGFLSAQIALKKDIKNLILLNPAIIPPQINVKTITGMPQSILRDMQNPLLFKQKINSKILIIRGSCDEVVPSNWVLKFARFQEATVKFLVDDHRLSKNLRNIPDIIKEFLDKKH